MIKRVVTIYNWAFRPDFYRGARAEQVFRAVCDEHKLVCAPIEQDRASWVRQRESGYGNVKRGDYLIRNRGNIEIEVKCLSVRTKNGKRCFFLSWSQIARHKAGTDMTGVPLFFAFFEPAGKRRVKKASLRLVRLEHLQGSRAIPRLPGVDYDENWKGLFIPLEVLTLGMSPLDQFNPASR